MEVVTILNSKQSLKKTLHIAVPVCLFIALYFPTLLSAIFTKQPNYYNPAVLLRTFFTSRVLWRVSLLTFVGLTLGACYILVKSWKVKLYEDKLQKKRTFSLDYQPYGDAHWAEPCEYSNIAKVRKIEYSKGVILGQLTKDCSQCIDMYKPPRLNKHMLVVGSSGSGKSFSLVEPYILQSVRQRHSIIVTDPKGELYAHTAGYLEDNGYLVRRFDLITLEKSDGWDCMKFLRSLSGDELETNAQIFANIIVSNIEQDESVYSRGATALLKALLLYVILNDSIPEEEKNIAKINEMLQQSGVEYFEQIFTTKNCSGKLKPALSSYQTFAQASPNLHGNIVSHLATGMQIIQTGLVEKMLSTDDIDMTLPGKQPCAYFCRFSATNNTFRFVSAMFFSMLFITQIDQADRLPTKKLAVNTDYVLDEFVSLGRIPDWLEKISNIRSYGITAVMIVQGISQLAGNYGDDATMIIGNCGTIMNIGLNDMESAQWFQDRMGITSIKVMTEQSPDGTEVVTTRARGGLLGKESVSVGKDYLMSVSDLFNMDVDDEIIIFQHCNPIYAHKVPITDFPEHKKCRPVDDKDIPNFSDTEARKKRREEELANIERYNREHTHVEEEEDEEYEEPVDFSSMGTTAIIILVIKDDIKAFKRWKNSRKKKQAPKVKEAPLEPEEPAVQDEIPVTKIDLDDEDDEIGIYFGDDDEEDEEPLPTETPVTAEPEPVHTEDREEEPKVQETVEEKPLEEKPVAEKEKPKEETKKSNVKKKSRITPGNHRASTQANLPPSQKKIPQNENE